MCNSSKHIRWAHYDNSAMTTKYAWKNYTPAATTVEVKLVFESSDYDMIWKATVKEFNSSGVQTKTATVSFRKSDLS